MLYLVISVGKIFFSCQGSFNDIVEVKIFNGIEGQKINYAA
jgi:hypothetical protein